MPTDITATLESDLRIPITRSSCKTLLIFQVFNSEMFGGEVSSNTMSGNELLCSKAGSLFFTRVLIHQDGASLPASFLQGALPCLAVGEQVQWAGGGGGAVSWVLASLPPACSLCPPALALQDCWGPVLCQNLCTIPPPPISRPAHPSASSPHCAPHPAPPPTPLHPSSRHLTSPLPTQT